MATLILSEIEPVQIEVAGNLWAAALVVAVIVANLSVGVWVRR